MSRSTYTNTVQRAIAWGLETHLPKAILAAMIYSNPNNPFICLTDEELKIIGEMATVNTTWSVRGPRLFCHGFRKDLGCPFEPPYQASVSVIPIIISCRYPVPKRSAMPDSVSAWQRSPVKLYLSLLSGIDSALWRRYVRYGIISTVSYIAQPSEPATGPIRLSRPWNKAAADGTFDFVSQVKGIRTSSGETLKIFYGSVFPHRFMITIWTNPIADGFYFTIGYPNDRRTIDGRAGLMFYVFHIIKHHRQ